MHLLDLVEILQLLNSECKIPQRLKGENDDIRWFSIAIIEQIYRVWFHFAVVICFTSLKEEEKISATNNGMKPYSWDEFLRLVRFKSKPTILLPPLIYMLSWHVNLFEWSGKRKSIWDQSSATSWHLHDYVHKWNQWHSQRGCVNTWNHHYIY